VVPNLQAAAAWLPIVGRNIGLEHMLLEVIGEATNASKYFCSELLVQELPKKHALLAKQITLD